jgi:hypothetical protein
MACDLAFVDEGVLDAGRLREPGGGVDVPERESEIV